MILDELAARATAISGRTFPVRVGFSPKDIDEVLVIRETGGTGSELGFGVAGIQYENPTIQVDARGVADDYATPRTEIERVYQDFPKVQAATLSGGGESAFYHTIIPRQEPFLAYIDEERRPVLTVVFDVKKEPSS